MSKVLWTIGELTNYVAANIADDWEITIRIMAGSGVVSLFDPSGCEVELCPDDDLETQVMEAVSYSREHSENT